MRDRNIIMEIGGGYLALIGPSSDIVVVVFYGSWVRVEFGVKDMRA